MRRNRTFRGRRRAERFATWSADRSGGRCAGRPGGPGRRIRNERNLIGPESGVILRSRYRGAVVKYDGFRPGHLADPALRFRLVVLVRQHPDRNREQHREHGSRCQEPGGRADVLHRGGCLQRTMLTPARGRAFAQRLGTEVGVRVSWRSGGSAAGLFGYPEHQARPRPVSGAARYVEIALGDDVHSDQEVDIRPEFFFQDGKPPHCRTPRSVRNP